MTHRQSDDAERHRLHHADPVTKGCARPPSTRNTIAFIPNCSVVPGSSGLIVPVVGAMHTFSRTLDAAVAPIVRALSP
ncbi:hypothetical protein BD293_4021 [Roseinatronobacter monicus]|uniref:Uncharacterized protein n=1 Tax=Roseinatronobacter monicus TaxID=393481 RepID=A0A543K4U4_9RHOB|nr:hypothetical protein BD293_4021 [Roseinatronobacter monicus]